MRKILTIMFAASLLLPSLVRAEQFQFDAALTQGSISFYPVQFYVGQTVRIYANIINFGTHDITGGVSFFQGAGALAAPTPFSLKANGANEDVWVDWTPTEGTYNIMVKVETYTTDQNPINNVYVTPMMTIQKIPAPLPPAQQAPAQNSLPPSQAKTSQQIPSTQPSLLAQVSEKKTLISAAEEIAKKLKNPAIVALPKSNPKNVRQQPKAEPVVAQQKPDTSSRKDGEQPVKLEQRVAKTIPPAVKGTKVILPEHEQNQQSGTTQWLKKQEKSGKQQDPVQAGIALGVLFTLLLLGGGFYFLKKSKQ
jgi:hypothetical protein